jgi:regulatory protein
VAFGSRKPRKPAEPLTESALHAYALDALGRRMRTVSDLKRLMRRRVEPDETGEAKIDRVVARLKEYEFLNDTRYAQEFTRLRQTNQKLGKRRVRAELAQHGVHGDLITETLDTSYADIKEEDLAFQHLQKKRAQAPKNDKEMNRLVSRLARAGFSTAAIFKALRRLKSDDALLASLEKEAAASSDEGDEPLPEI